MSVPVVTGGGWLRRHVAIVGGGPGGAQCARSLAESGFDVTLFEPRSGFEKPCGGGIPERGLRRFPFLADPCLPVKTVRRCLIVSPSGREADVPLRDPLYIFRRGDLHDFLLRRAVEAGARHVRGWVLSFARAGSASGADGSPARGWTLRVAAGDRGGPVDQIGPYDFLVAADGAAGSTRRHLIGSIPGDDLTQGIGYYLPGLSEEQITLKFYPGLDGYLWVFPRPEHSSAGICAGLGARPASALKALMDDFLIERYGGDILRRAERYAALIPVSPRPDRAPSLTGDGWALVGDSGQAVDPLTREGIYYAMHAGQVLAESLTAGEPESYPRRWRRGPGREFAWAARHADAFFEPRFIERLVGVCGRSPAAARVLSDVMSGLQAYRTLTLRLLANGPAIALDLARSLKPSRGSSCIGR